MEAVETQSMTKEEFLTEYHHLHKFFSSGQTKSVQFRLECMRRLRDVIRAHERDILDAMWRDMRKSDFEGFGGDIGLVYQEINDILRNLNSWSRPQRVAPHPALFYSANFILKEPLGVALIISPWNYPFQLLMTPLVYAIAAGNCAVVKPSELSPNTSAIIVQVLDEAFPKGLVKVVTGDGAELVPMMMEAVRFDHVFFTGSVAVGRKIAEMAAGKLIPVTLELGGKSPAIVDRSVDLKEAAKRITWGKYFNAGQTCVAPDYVLVPSELKEEFIGHCQAFIKQFYGPDPRLSADYARIINSRRFQAVCRYLEEGSIICGGQTDESDRYIAPTILTDVSLDSDVMKEEIFGPVMPVISYQNLEETFDIINRNPYPLSFYIFSKSKRVQRVLTAQFPFGNGSINHCLLNFVNIRLPFGGVGMSGMGRYHGKAGFDLFSNHKTMMRFGFLLDNPILYPPYAEWKKKLVAWFLRKF
jgi:aldehyde dehydrogenase (NAD+)